MTDLEQIQQTLLEIYAKNINFFQIHHKDLYQQILEFENNFQENYFIDFINNHFELFDKNNIPTYNCDPFYDAQYRVQNLNKYISGISTIDFQKREVRTNKEYDSNNFINQFINLIDGKDCDENTKYHKIIFIGTLLGVHINDIANNMNIDSIFIVEDNLEIFRLSMFLTDYAVLAKNSKLFLAINCDKQKLYNKTKEFLEYKFQYNYFIKFEVASEKEIGLLKTLQTTISSQSKTIYSYSQFLEAYEHSKININNCEKLLQLNTKHNILNNQNVLFLGAGPSLQDNINFIKENKDKFLIVTVLATLKRLEKEGIAPDIILSIDSSDLLINFLPKDTLYYKNSIVIVSTNTYPLLVKKLNTSSNLFLLQTNLELFDDFGNFTGYNIGDIGLQILLQLGANQIYLLGIDAALNQITGQTHDITHHYIKEKKLDETIDDNIDFGERVFKVQGNLKDKVYTTGAYNLMIDSINSIDIPKNIKIFNLSNHGAKFDNIQQIKPRNVKIKNYLCQNNQKQSLLNNLNNINKKIDSNKLNSTIKIQIKNEYEKLITPYCFYILENLTNQNEKDLDNLKKQQLQIIDKYISLEDLNMSICNLF